MCRPNDNVETHLFFLLVYAEYSEYVVSMEIHPPWRYVTATKCSVMAPSELDLISGKEGPLIRIQYCLAYRRIFKDKEKIFPHWTRLALCGILL